MDANIINLIEPDVSLDRVMKCCSCGMSYCQEDYLVLKNAQKLSYFDYVFDDGSIKASVSPVCHFCLKDVVLKHNGGKETSVVINTQAGKKFHCSFYESDKD